MTMIKATDQLKKARLKQTRWSSMPLPRGVWGHAPTEKFQKIVYLVLAIKLTHKSALSSYRQLPHNNF